MTVAVRALIELFRFVGRQNELHREILAFSISHNHSSVRIYGHYATIEGDETSFYRHPIKEFIFASEDGKDKWTALTVTKNIYDRWMPIQHKRICSAVDDLPSDVDFDLSQSAASFSQSGPQSSRQSKAESGFMLDQGNSQSRLTGSQKEVTPTSTFTQTTERAFKKPKNQRATSQLR